MAVAGLIIIILYALIAASAPILPIYSYETIILDHQHLRPSLTKSSGDLVIIKRKSELYSKAWKFKQLKLSDELNNKVRALVKDNKTNAVWDILYNEGERQIKEGTFKFDKASQANLDKLVYDIKTALLVEIYKIKYIPDNQYLKNLDAKDLITVLSELSNENEESIIATLERETISKLKIDLAIEEPDMDDAYYDKKVKKIYADLSSSKKNDLYSENILGKIKYIANNILIKNITEDINRGKIKEDFPLKGYFSVSDKLEVKAKVSKTFDRHYLLGTDAAGRDLLSRIIYGSQISIAIGLIGTITSVLLGVVIGAIAGYKGGKTDYFIMRFVDIMYGLPYMLLVIIFIAISGRSIFNLFIALAIISWLTVARMVRGQIMSLKNQEFVEAAKSMGASTPRILFKHLVPNSLSIIIVFSTLRIPSFIMMESFLSFLGLGVQAPRTSLGALIGDGVASMTLYPWKLIFPAITMTLFLFAMNFLGDGLRDAFDPQSKNEL